MESLFGIIVILYLVASVIGAVLQRMQKGPITGDEAMPKSLPRQPGQPKPMETAGIPSMPLPPVAEDRQMVEVLDVTNEDESHIDTLAPGSQVSDWVEDLEPVGQESWSFTEGEWDWDEEMDTHDKRRKARQEAGQMAAKAKSPAWRVTAPQWRRAVVLSEIMGKPRALRPFRPVGME